MKQITIHQAIGLKLFTIISLIGLFNSCSKSCPDSGTKTTYVDKSYLPFIIPYSDTSTRLFLKNGKDTLLFKSLDLKESFISGSSLGSGDCTYNYKNQEFNLRMAASDTDFFDIKYHALYASSSRVNYSFNIGQYYDQTYQLFHLFNYLTPQKIKVLNTTYDSSYSLPDPNFEAIIINPKIGLLMVKTSEYSLELVK
ncbi:MAG: hypothetical protein ACOYMA_07920 [Bacteroidia bacterium]